MFDGILPDLWFGVVSYFIGEFVSLGTFSGFQNGKRAAMFLL